MSVVVAIKSGDKVYVGADSQVTRGGTRITLKNPNNYKIWKVNDDNNCIMGHVGYVRDANVVRLITDFYDDYDEYLDRINYRYMVRYVVPKIISELQSAGYLKEDKYVESLNSSFIFAYKDRLFSIGSDCTVIEVDDYVAIGSGSNEAIGSLLSTEGLDPQERIIRAIKASVASDIYVDYPIVLACTGKESFAVINEDSEVEFRRPVRKPNGKDSKESKNQSLDPVNEVTEDETQKAPKGRKKK